MPETQPPPRLTSREFTAINMYANGFPRGDIARVIGISHPSHLDVYTSEAYKKLGVHDSIGAVKLLRDRLDVASIVKGHNLTNFNRLGAVELSLIDYMVNLPPQEPLTSPAVQGFGQALNMRYPKHIFSEMIYPIVGAHNRAQLTILYQEYLKLKTPDNYIEPNIPPSENIENKIPQHSTAKHFEVTPEDLRILGLHVRGVLDLNVGNSAVLGFKDQPPPERLTSEFVTQPEDRKTLKSVIKLVQTGKLDIRSLVDDRDLLRFRSMSSDERSAVEALLRRTSVIREVSYANLKRKFGVATSEHLGILFFAYTQIYEKSTPGPKNHTENPRFIGEIINKQQAEIIQLAIQGSTIGDIYKKLGISQDKFIGIMDPVFDALGLEKPKGKNRDRNLLLTINMLMDNQEIDTEEVAKDYDLEIFETLRPAQQTAVRNLSLGIIQPGEHLSRAVGAIGASSVYRLAILYRRYQEQISNLHAQGFEPAETDRAETDAIKVYKRFLKGASMSDSLEAEGYSPATHGRTLYQIQNKRRDTSSSNEFVLNLIARGEIDPKEVIGDFDTEKFDELSRRELVVCQLLAQGLNSSTISQRLGISLTSTGETITSIYKKTQLPSSHSERLITLFLIYQYPRNYQIAAQERGQRDYLDIVGIQATKLKLKGMSEVDIATTLDISQELLQSHTDRLSVTLGTAGHTETLMELYRAGRIDISELVKSYKIADFSSLNDFQIGILETLVTQDPRRFLTYLEKMSHYLQKTPSEIKEDLKDIQLQIGLTPYGISKSNSHEIASEESESPEVSSQTTETASESRQDPPSERQLRFADEVYNETNIDKVFSFVNRFMRNPERAQDITQDVFMSIYKDLDSLEDRDLMPFILTRARYRSLEALKSDRQFQEVSYDSFEHDSFNPSNFEEEQEGQEISLNFKPIEIEKLALLYMEYRKHLHFSPHTLFES